MLGGCGSVSQVYWVRSIVYSTTRTFFLFFNGFLLCFCYFRPSNRGRGRLGAAVRREGTWALALRCSKYRALKHAEQQ